MISRRLEKGRNFEEDENRRSRSKLPLVILFVGVSLSIIAYFWVRHWEEATIRADFERLSATHTTDIDHELTRHLDASDYFAGFYDASQHIERQEFRLFASKILSKHDDIQAIMWAPRVSETERATVEQEAAREGLANFHIHINNSGDAVTTNAQNADYYPVLYLQPMELNKAWLGLDVMNDPDYQSVLETARDTGNMGISPPVRLTTGPGQSSEFGVLLAQPVYQKSAKLDTQAERRAGLEGFLLQMISIGTLVEESLQESVTLGLDVSLVYAGKSGEVQQIYFHPSVSRGGFERGLLGSIPNKSTADLQAKLHLKSLGNSWVLIFTPAPRFSSNHVLWQSWAVLAAGLIISLLSWLCLYISSARSIHRRT